MVDDRNGSMSTGLALVGATDAAGQLRKFAWAGDLPDSSR